MNSKLRKIISSFLVVVMMFSLVGGALPVMAKDLTGYEPAMSVSKLESSDAEAEAGSSYSISSARELMDLSDYVLSGRNTAGAIFYISEDIDMSGRAWQPIGSSSVPFEGIFDGCGFAVLNLSARSDKGCIGLFGSVSGAGSLIKNLGVNGEVSGADNCAGIVGELKDGAVVNCWNGCKVSGGSSIAGIVGMVSGGSIVNCANYGYIYGSSSTGALAGSLGDSASVYYSYYTYYGADLACGSVADGCSVSAYRFAASPTMCPTEKSLTVGSYTGNDLTKLLNAWIDLQENSGDYRSWLFSEGEDAAERTGGQYPYHKYPGYKETIEPVYTATATMTTLYNMKKDASAGACYSISDAKELSLLADYVNEGFNTEGATFFLTADMSIISADSHYKGESWVPIGQSPTLCFKGVFDAQGFVITELIIDDSYDNAGLFGYVDGENAVIKNVAAVGNIAGGKYSGGIAANLVRGTVENCWFNGAVIGDTAGGIVGQSEMGSVTNCVYFGTVSGKVAGGIAGISAERSTMQFCYYSNDNPAEAGKQQGNAYLNPSFYVRDGVYYLERSVNIDGRSTIRLLNALNYWVETLAGDDTILFWKQDKSAASIARIRASHPTQIYWGDPSELVYIDETNQELEKKDNPYDVIYTETATMTELYESKTDAQPGGNYSISTGKELALLSDFVEEGFETKDANFYLTDNVNIADAGIDDQGAGWTPIGPSISIDFGTTSLNYFRGNFDGCGYTVSGLYIVSDFLNFCGLFGRCDGSTIKNLGVAGEMLGDDECGGIVGHIINGQIINCWSSVSIQCSTELGGIAGYAKDTVIKNCASYGMLITTLDEGEKSGGIVGKTGGDTVIENCYYLNVGADAPYDDLGKNTTVKDILPFAYNVFGNQDCTLEHAITVGDVTTDDLLTALNAWVYDDNSGQYCSWHIAASLTEIPGANGYFPVLTKPTITKDPENNDYCGDYTATATVSELYSTRSDGIKGCCYSINGLDDLQAFRMYVNDGYATSGIIFFMTRDIDMSQVYSAETGKSWTPVGTVKEPFKGIFDGQGYTLKYLYIQSSADDQALFGQVTGSGAIIKNLGISGIVASTGVNSAAIVADLNFATIANCWSSCEVTGGVNTGGIAGGTNTGKIINCTNYGAIVGTSSYGAISGFPVGTRIEYCYYLYATCQQAYPEGSTPIATGVQYFNGTSAACILHEKVNIEGTETRNALSALKLYVDAHRDINYCYWDVGNTLEYAAMGVTGFPVLISASNTKGEIDRKTVQAYFNGEEYYSVVKAINAANDSENGGDVTLAVNAVLYANEDVSLDENVRLLTGDFSLVIKSDVKVYSMQQLIGVFIDKEGGSISLFDSSDNSYKLFMYSQKKADASCNSQIYSTDSLTFRSGEVKDAGPEAYNLSLQDGNFIINSTLESGNPHGFPPASTLTIERRGTLTVSSNARIRTTGGAEVMNEGTVKIGNATLERNGGVRMKGVFEDDGGLVTLPFIYKDGYTLRGWSDGTNIYQAGTKVDVQKATTFTAQWNLGEGPDPYPGDDSYSDSGDPVYNIKMNVIQSKGGTITPGSLNAAKGENLSFGVKADTGYITKNFLVDGQSAKLDENGNYKFTSVSREHSMVAFFAPVTNSAYYDWQSSFTDVRPGDWCYDNVRYVVSAGMFNGKTSTTFAPDDPMTREMVVVVLWRLSGEPIIPGSDCSFTDVSKSSYAYEAIRWANYFGIVQGFSETRFGYGQSVNREQLVTFLFRYAKNYAGNDVSLYDSTNILGYEDVLSISKGMTQPFQWAIGAGIVNGTTSTTLTPKGLATRAQVAAILSRYCNQFINTVPVFNTGN